MAPPDISGLPRSRDMDFLSSFEFFTGLLRDRLSSAWNGRHGAAEAPVKFWAWLNADGADVTAPWRGVVGAFLMILVCWSAQAIIRAILKRVVFNPRRPTVRQRAAMSVVGWVLFMGSLAFFHAIVPEVSRASRVFALALILAFAGTWISFTAIVSVIPALYRDEGPSQKTEAPELLLGLGLIAFFMGLFGIMTLREAGIAADARLFLGLAVWLVSGSLLFVYLQLRYRSAGRTAIRTRSDFIEIALERWGSLAMRITVLAVVIATAGWAIQAGPGAFQKGVASLGLVAGLIALLGLLRTRGRTVDVDDVRLPWVAVIRRGTRLIAILGFLLLMAAIWDVDIFHAANARLGDRIVHGIITILIVAGLGYLSWQAISTALAQSWLAVPQGQQVRGEEGGGTIGTRLQTFGPVLRNFLFVALVTLSLMVCLSALGVDIKPLLAGAGVIGIALGFGAQTLVRDIISGVFFLAEDAFRTGEYIEIGRTRGTVEGIAIRSLKLRHHRGAVHTVPFGEIKQLTNYSRDWIIMKLEFLLDFETDLKLVKNIVKKIGKELDQHSELGHALLEPVKSQGVRRIEPTGIVVGLKFMAKPGSEVYMLRREVYHRVRDAFEQNGIRFARPRVIVTSAAEGAAAAAHSLSAAAGPQPDT